MGWKAPLALTVVALAGLLLLHQARSRAEHRDPSYRFGQDVMLNQVYPKSWAGSVRKACEAAIAHSTRSGLDKHRAVDGCVDQESALDN